MTDKITITRTDSGFALNVDGGNIECGTTAEVMSRVGHEMGMPYIKAQRQLFERMEAAEKAASVAEREASQAELEREQFELAALQARQETEKLRSAIVGWFVRAYGGGTNGKVH